jgi:putative addiction module CopG family antidote
VARSFDLDPESEAIIEAAVASGRFDTPDAAVREAIALLRARTEAVKRLNAEIQIGLDAIGAGDVEDAEVVLDRLQTKYRDMAAQQQAAE